MDSQSQKDQDQDQDQDQEQEPEPSSTQLLQLAHTHLRLRNFSLSRQYALESRHPNATVLATVSDILLATSSSTTTNWYSVLQLDTFSDNQTLIRAHFKKLLLLLDPIKDQIPFASQALDFVWKAYNYLSNPNSKSYLDSQLYHLIYGDEKDEGGFWTFCPYCFYVYLYARVFEGCCLRCQNEGCRRAFHGVSLCSLPRMELDKGQYFGCFGYFPLGFSPSQRDGKGKFESWSPIVGLFPVKRMRKTCAGRVDFDSDENVVEILDDNDNVNEYGHHQCDNVEKPHMMRRKTVAWNAKKLRSRRTNDSGPRLDDDNDGGDGVSGFESTTNVAGGSGLGGEGDNDMNFFEEDGEIFVGFEADDSTF